MHGYTKIRYQKDCYLVSYLFCSFSSQICYFIFFLPLLPSEHSSSLLPPIPLLSLIFLLSLSSLFLQFLFLLPSILPSSIIFPPFIPPGEKSPDRREQVTYCLSCAVNTKMEYSVTSGAKNTFTPLWRFLFSMDSFELNLMA